MKNYVMSRIGDNFHKELEEIKDYRLKKGLDKERTSSKVLTNLIIRNKYWKLIKKGLKEIESEEIKNKINGVQ